MCGAFSIRINPYEAREIYDSGVPAWKPIYNARPGEWLPIITEAKPNSITSAYWGFIPHWMDPTKGKAVINARGETLATKPYFRSAVAGQRCIIPADGFYEWQKRTDPRFRGDSVPYFFHRRDDKPFAFAGVYDVVPAPTPIGRDKADGKGETKILNSLLKNQSEASSIGVRVGFAIITTSPNALVAKVHDRMPVMLQDDAVDEWLNPSTTADQAVKFLTSYPEELMASYVVSRAVNLARNKGQEVIEAAK